MDTGVTVQYILVNESTQSLSAYFVTRLDFALSGTAKKQPLITVYDAQGKSELGIERRGFKNVDMVIVDETSSKFRFSLEGNEKPNVVLSPIVETDQVYGVRAFFYWKIDLHPSYSTEKMLFLNFEKLTSKKS